MASSKRRERERKIWDSMVRSGASDDEVLKISFAKLTRLTVTQGSTKIAVLLGVDASGEC